MKIRIEIGSGISPRSGYIHCDLYPAPHVEVVCTAPAIPFRRGSVDEIYARHVLEHLTLKEAKTALGNWYDVLKPSGRIDVNVPDFEKSIKQLNKSGYSPYLNTRVSNRDHAIASIYGWQKNDRDFHKWGYTYETLSRMLYETGYRNINRIKDDSRSGPVNLRLVASKDR